MTPRAPQLLIPSPSLIPEEEWTGATANCYRQSSVQDVQMDASIFVFPCCLAAGRCPAALAPAQLREGCADYS
ncbi:hypothetical protein H920_11263 [Fukomys damarensis]|uniref:Uncharacterized protein n=1 Tax=Fukomys damarensis TaxID=885580 RepID=A0A091DX27_FUKDA|nr:hypothetical protein H920_11263 [Fukomys damarensis]